MFSLLADFVLMATGLSSSSWALLKIEDNDTGVYRKSKVFISGSNYPLPNPEKVQGLMDEFVKNIGIHRINEHPVILAAKAHLEFLFIHPFIDGNGEWPGS